MNRVRLFETHAVEHLLDFGKVACHSRQRNVFNFEGFAANAVERFVVDDNVFSGGVLIVAIGKVVLRKVCGQELHELDGVVTVFRVLGHSATSNVDVCARGGLVGVHHTHFFHDSAVGRIAGFDEASQVV